jgi:hypothetical protein
MMGGLLGFFVENSVMRFLPGGRRSQDNNNFLVPLFSLFAKAAKETGGPTTRQLQFVNLLFRSQFFLGWRSQETAVRAFETALEDDKSTEDWINTISAFPLDGFRKHWLLQTTAQLLSMETGGLTQRGQEILSYLASQLGMGYRFSTAGNQGGYRQGFRTAVPASPIPGKCWVSVPRPARRTSRSNTGSWLRNSTRIIFRTCRKTTPSAWKPRRNSLKSKMPTTNSKPNWLSKAPEPRGRFRSREKDNI